MSNLWLSVGIVSASHVGVGSSRVMATSAYASQALGPAVALCLKYGLSPRDLVQSPLLEEYQQRLLHAGQHIPGHAYQIPLNIAREASMLASSEFVLSEFRSEERRVGNECVS